jgi:hypothetical protein
MKFIFHAFWCANTFSWLRSFRCTDQSCFAP